MEGTDEEEDTGSNELLLGATQGEEDELVKKDFEEAEESIQLLIDVLEEESNKSKSSEGRKRSNKERGQRVGDSNTETKPPVSYADTRDEAIDCINQNEMGSAPELKLIISENSTCSHGKFGGSSKRPASAGVITRDKLALKLLKKHRSETGKVICGVVILLIMLGLGGTMLALAWILSMQDLFILGGIFLAGGLIFTIAFIVVRCKAKDENDDTDYSVLYKTAIGSH